MGDLPATTEYNTRGGDTSGTANNVRRAAKSVDVSKYGSLTQGVQKSRMPSEGNVTTPFGGKTKYEESHPAIDIANQPGTDVQSATEGQVTDVNEGAVQGGPGYGNFVEVTDTEGNRHRYSHLQDAYVSVGQAVSSQQSIGSMGNSGQTYSPSGGSGSHLDYRV